jgi:hypothetical protein
MVLLRGDAGNVRVGRRRKLYERIDLMQAFHSFRTLLFHALRDEYEMNP